ncbi:MAG: hypothetical protein ACRD4L_13520, partial [Pyrinomonadaceae bacterium]
LYMLAPSAPYSADFNAHEDEIELKRVQIKACHEILAFTDSAENSPPIKLRFKRNSPQTRLARKIIRLDPKSISTIRSAHGETLLFNGLAFARVRCVVGIERGWFGVEPREPSDRQHIRELNDETWPELLRLVQELKIHRSGAASPNASKRHILCGAAPEKWLEAILRRDITQLDPGLILSPLYAQLRLPPILPPVVPIAGEIKSSNQSSHSIDLLALRNDGRLVIIELKAVEDRQIIFQGVGYWLRVEAHRRAGNLKRAALFGRKKIADLPPLIYLVAPGLRFSRDTQILGALIIPEIEIHRFDINEDWRNGVRVMRWMKINPGLRSRITKLDY